jgi:ATP-dependent RNA helicase DeaD
VEALTGERVASFLPIVAQLSEGYDVHTVAAAALQLVYDRSRPAYLDMEEPAPQERGDRYERGDRGDRGGYDRRGGGRRSNHSDRSGGESAGKPVLRQGDVSRRDRTEDRSEGGGDRDYQEARGAGRRRR